MRRPLFRQLWTLKLPRVAEISGVWNDQFFTNCNNVYPPNFFSCWIVYEKVLPSLFWTFQISNLSWNLPYSYFAFDTAFLSDLSSFRCLLFSFSRIVFSIPLFIRTRKISLKAKNKIHSWQRFRVPAMDWTWLTVAAKNFIHLWFVQKLSPVLPQPPRPRPIISRKRSERFGFPFVHPNC